MTRPRIGITLGLDRERGRYELPRAYADAVLAAGGLPLPLAYGEGVPAAALELLDGLVLSGGDFDVDPARYGEARRPACGPANPERTDFEWALCEAALAASVPLLGVCGGMQLLAVVRGGTLYQDLGEDLGLRGHEQPRPKDAPHHAVELAPGSLLARLVGPEPLRVNSTHHQAVREPGRAVVVTARAPDGVVEAIEVTDAPFALGVQWHPEAVARHDRRHAAIYGGLVEAAARDRAGR